LYAIIRSGGKQYRVAEGDRVRLESIAGEVGDEVSLEDVLLVGHPDSTEVGTPFLRDVRVIGTIVEQGKDRKVTVFKFKRRKMYRSKQGHRQRFTEVEIGPIRIGNESPVRE
jgi:large subunit ribosomal protein L21